MSEFLASLNWKALAFAFALSVLTGLISGPLCYEWGKSVGKADVTASVDKATTDQVGKASEANQNALAAEIEDQTKRAEEHANLIDTISYVAGSTDNDTAPDIVQRYYDGLRALRSGTDGSP